MTSKKIFILIACSLVIINLQASRPLFRFAQLLPKFAAFKLGSMRPATLKFASAFKASVTQTRHRINFKTPWRINCFKPIKKTACLFPLCSIFSLFPKDPMLKACLSNDVNQVKKLLAENKDYLERPCDFDNNTPLLVAVKYGQFRLVSLLLKEGANIHAKNREGITPLMMAKKYGCKSIVRDLTEAENGTFMTLEDQIRLRIDTPTVKEEVPPLNEMIKLIQEAVAREDAENLENEKAKSTVNDQPKSRSDWWKDPLFEKRGVSF